MSTKPIRLQNDHTGFTVIEVILFTFVVILISSVGDIAYRHYQKTINASCVTSVNANVNATIHVGTKLYTDSSGTYRIAYPSDWSVLVSSNPTSSSSASSLDSTAPEFYDQSYPAACMNDSEDAPEVVLASYKSGNMSRILSGDNLNDGVTSVVGGFNPQSLTINGYKAIYVHVVFSQPGYGSVFDIYTVTHNNVTLVFSFEESQTGNAISPYDFSSYFPIYTSLVKSVKFLN